MTTIDIRAINTTELKVKTFPLVDHGFRVVMAESALDRCVERGSADMSREIGGILVGDVLKDDSGPYVRVDETIDALHADEKGAELTFTHETWEHINQEMDTKHAGKKIVGWYHTHPGFGVFLSDRDEFIHKSFFDQPFQIALVYDPKTREQGVFAWEKGSTARMSRYWIGKREVIWKRPETPALASSQESKAVPLNPTEGEGEGFGRVDWGATAMVGLILLILGGAGGWWMGSGSAARTQGQMQAMLVDARLEGAQEAIKTLDMRVMSTVRAGFDNSATEDAMAVVEMELSDAISALDATEGAVLPEGGADPSMKIDNNSEKPAAKERGSTNKTKAIAKINRAREAAAKLARQRGNVAAALAELEHLGARSRTSEAEAKSLSVQRAALASLYADLSKDAKKAGDSKRAARYLEVARRVNPKSGPRFDKGKGKEKKNQKGLDKNDSGKKKSSASTPGMKR